MKKSIINVSETSNVMIPIENNLSQFNNAQANEIRLVLPEMLSKPTIENMNNYIKASIFPILFEEIYVRHISTSENNKKSLQMDDITVLFIFIL
jgi:hypothetical protein